ncbi:MAG: WYL domain-containing protein, partial [Bacteroidota bacterium]
MEKEKPRLVRLTAILTQLQAKRMMTARQLAGKHGVSIRTIYRDIRTLEQSGIPIVVEEGRGYRLLEGYQLPPVMFTEAEANALVTVELLLGKRLDSSLTEHYTTALTKIRSILRSGQKAKTELLMERLQIRSYDEDAVKRSHLMALQSAITDFQVVDLSYQSVRGVHSRRRVEPFALYRTQLHWIMIAYCRVRQDFRSFRLTGIQELRPTGQQFDPHSLTLADYLRQARENSRWTPATPLSVGGLNLRANQNHQIFCAMQTVSIESFYVVGIAVRTKKANGQAERDIPALWERFLREGVADRITDKLDPTVYAVYTDYEGDHTQDYTFLIGCRVVDLEGVPEGMTGR